MDTGVAGTAGGGLDRFFPPRPNAIMKVITTGIQANFSYLRHGSINRDRFAKKYKVYLPAEDFISAK
jgi:hypothetical protein